MPIALDTVHLSFPFYFIESMDNDKFRISESTTKHGLIIKNYFLRQKRLGLESLIINERSQKVSMKISSKILGLNYSQGLCNDTLDQFICEVKQSGITINRDFIEEVIVTRVDVKNDIKMNKAINVYINSLNHLTASGFAKTPYKTGITFNENISTSPVRLSFYGKEFEMKQQKKFYKFHPQLINTFDNILRIESRFSKSITIKKHFGSNRLLDILNSENINSKIFCKIVDKQKFAKVLDVENLTLTEEKNLGQIYLLHRLYNGNFYKIANHIKSKLSENTKATYQINNARIYFDMIESSNDSLLKDNIEEIENALIEQT